MLAETNPDRLATQILSLTRQQITDLLLSFRTDFPMDFTRDYLERLPLDRLQHLLLAACLHRHRKSRTPPR